MDESLINFLENNDSGTYKKKTTHEEIISKEKDGSIKRTTSTTVEETISKKTDVKIKSTDENGRVIIKSRGRKPLKKETPVKLLKNAPNNPTTFKLSSPTKIKGIHGIHMPEREAELPDNVIPLNKVI